MKGAPLLSIFPPAAPGSIWHSEVREKVVQNPSIQGNKAPPPHTKSQRCHSFSNHGGCSTSKCSVLYTNNDLSEGEMKKTISFTNASKRIKYLGINLTKEVKDLYSENYKTVMKEIEDVANKWKYILCLWTGKINIIKLSIYPKKSTDSMQFLSKYSTNTIAHRTRTNNTKICMESQKTPNSQSTLEKEEQSWRCHVP